MDKGGIVDVDHRALVGDHRALVGIDVDRAMAGIVITGCGYSFSLQSVVIVHLANAHRSISPRCPGE